MKHCVVSALQMNNPGSLSKLAPFVALILNGRSKGQGRARLAGRASSSPDIVKSSWLFSSLATSLKWLEIFQNRCLVNLGNIKQQCITYTDVFRILNGGNGQAWIPISGAELPYLFTVGFIWIPGGSNTPIGGYKAYFLPSFFSVGRLKHGIR